MTDIHGLGSSRDMVVTRSNDTWTQDDDCFLVQVEKGSKSPYISQSRRGMQVAIQEDQAGELGLQRLHLKYYRERALKCLLNPNPTTPILVSSHRTVHVILG